MKINKLWFKDFLISNLDDVSFGTLSDEHVIHYEGQNQKWVASKISAISLFIRKLFNKDVFVAEGESLVLIDPDIDAYSLDVEGNVEIL